MFDTPEIRVPAGTLDVVSDHQHDVSAEHERAVADPSATSDAVLRYRCDACGNLTRFDVTEERRTRAFHHYSVGGELSIESVEVLDAAINDVSCRWCGHGRAVVPYGSPTAGADQPAASTADGVDA